MTYFPYFFEIFYKILNKKHYFHIKENDTKKVKKRKGEKENEITF